MDSLALSQHQKRGIKKILVEKLLEISRDLEPEEALSLVGLNGDIASLVDDLILQRLEALDETQLTILLAEAI